MHISQARHTDKFLISQKPGKENPLFRDDRSNQAATL